MHPLNKPENSFTPDKMVTLFEDDADWVMQQFLSMQYLVGFHMQDDTKIIGLSEEG